VLRYTYIACLVLFHFIIFSFISVSCSVWLEFYLVYLESHAAVSARYPRQQIFDTTDFCSASKHKPQIPNSLSWLKGLFAGLSPREPVFNPMQFSVASLLVRVALRPVCLRAVWFLPCQYHSTSAPWSYRITQRRQMPGHSKGSDFLPLSLCMR
jgi:hypothetical protein